MLDDAQYPAEITSSTEAECQRGADVAQALISCADTLPYIGGVEADLW